MVIAGRGGGRAARAKCEIGSPWWRGKCGLQTENASRLSIVHGQEFLRKALPNMPFRPSRETRVRHGQCPQTIFTQGA